MGSRSKVTQDAIAARRGRIAAGRLRGMTLGELAAAEGIHKATASRDLQAIRQEWRQFRVESMEQMQNQTAQRYDTLLHADLGPRRGRRSGRDSWRSGDRGPAAARCSGLTHRAQERVTVVARNGTARRSTSMILMAELPPEIVVAARARGACR